MRKRLGLLLILIPAIASAAYVLNGSGSNAGAAPAPKTLGAPQATPRESSDPSSKPVEPVESDDAHTQAPQQSAGEVIGVPMLASSGSAELVARMS
jgi:hypothetical protein